MLFRRTFVLAVLLALVLAGAVWAADEPVDIIAKILQAEDSLTYDGFLAETLLDKQQSPLARRLAGRAIAHIGDTEGSPVLIKALTDATLDRAMVCHCLGMLWANSPEKAFKVEIPPIVGKTLLAAAATDLSLEVRAAAFEALAFALPGLGHKEAREAVTAAVNGDLAGDPVPLLLAAMRVAGAKGVFQSIEPPLLAQQRREWREAVLGSGLTHPEARVAYAAAYWSGREDARRLELDHLLEQTLGRATNGDANAAALVRAQALRALARRANADPDVAAAAVNMLMTGTLQEKIAAVDAVAQFHSPDQSFDLLKRALADAGVERVTSLHQAIFEQLGRSKADAAAAFLWQTAEQNVPYRAMARLAAAQAGAKDEIAGLQPLDFTATEEDALHYVELLDAADAQKKLDWLAGGQNVPAQFIRIQPVRRRIVMALVHDPQGAATDAVVRHESWLMDGDPIVRALAAESLAASKDPDRVKRLVGMARRATKDGSTDVTLSVFDALERLSSDKDTNVSAEIVLAEMARRDLEDERLVVRRKAVATMYETTREIHKKPLYGAVTGKSLGDYQSLARRLLDGKDAATTMLMHTSKGPVRFTVRRDLAPLTADNFIRLAITEFYDGLVFHRVVPAFVAQSGDPQRLGSGGPGYAIREEECALTFGAGALGMATSGHDTGGSQFFFTVVPTPHLDGRYTALGQVDDATSLAVLEALVIGDRVVSIRTDMAGKKQ